MANSISHGHFRALSFRVCPPFEGPKLGESPLSNPCARKANRQCFLSFPSFSVFLGRSLSLLLAGPVSGFLYPIAFEIFLPSGLLQYGSSYSFWKYCLWMKALYESRIVVSLEGYLPAPFLWEVFKGSTDLLTIVSSPFTMCVAKLQSRLDHFVPGSGQTIRYSPAGNTDMGSKPLE